LSKARTIFIASRSVNAEDNKCNLMFIDGSVGIVPMLRDVGEAERCACEIRQGYTSVTC
jgi:prepilin-type processing-associated H-X9-DG protein